MSEENSLGSILKRARVRMAWTQREVADKLNISRTTLYRWENDLQHPSAFYHKQIIAVLGLNEKESGALYHPAVLAPPIIDNLPFQPTPSIPGREEDADSLYSTAELAPPMQEPPGIDNLPPENPFFTGRETELDQLRKELQETDTSTITQQPVSIAGLAGIGKTELALAYAYRFYPNVYRVALRVNAANQEALQASYVELAEVLKLPERNEQNLARCIRVVKDWLKAHTNWLLIMDNADNLELARSFFPSLPRGHQGHILLTTRSKFGRRIGARQLIIDKMEPEEGLAFLLRRSIDANPYTVAEDILEPAKQLVNLMDGLPLALDQAGAYIEETGESFTNYLKFFNEQRGLFLAKRRALKDKQSEHPEYRHHPETVAATIRLSFRKAWEQHHIATLILNYCAFLQPDAIPEELFDFIDRLAFNDAIAALQRYSLIKRNTQEKSISIHRLVQAMLVSVMPPDTQNLWRERVVQALLSAFPVQHFEKWAQCERMLSQVLVCTTWSDEVLSRTAGVGALLTKASRYLFDRGRYSEAETPTMCHLSFCKRRYGVESPHTAPYLSDLAILYTEQGKYSQAEPLLQQALAIEGKHLGPEHPLTAQCLHNMACLYMSQDKDEQAESLFRRAFSIYEKSFGAESPHVVLPLYGIGILLHKQGKYEQAEELYQRALSIQEQELGPTHPHIEQTKRNHSKLLHSTLHGAESTALGVNYEPSKSATL